MIISRYDDYNNFGPLFIIVTNKHCLVLVDSRTILIVIVRRKKEDYFLRISNTYSIFALKMKHILLSYSNWPNLYNDWYKTLGTYNNLYTTLKSHYKYQFIKMSNNCNTLYRHTFLLLFPHCLEYLSGQALPHQPLSS